MFIISAFPSLLLEHSVGLEKFSLTLGGELTTRLLMFCISSSDGSWLPTGICSIPTGSSSSWGSYATSIISISFLFLLFGPLITPVSVKGETLGQVSSSTHTLFTLARTQSLVIVTGWGISPLYTILWNVLIDVSIIFPTSNLYPFNRTYKRMTSFSLILLRCLVGIITEAIK